MTIPLVISSCFSLVIALIVSVSLHEIFGIIGVPRYSPTKASTCFFNKGVNSVVNHTNDPLGHQHYSKKKGGLSTGGIIAIIIPCVLVLLGATALAFAYKRNVPPTQGVALGNNTLGAANSSTNVVTS